MGLISIKVCKNFLSVIYEGFLKETLIVRNGALFNADFKK